MVLGVVRILCKQRMSNFDKITTEVTIFGHRGSMSKTSNLCRNFIKIVSTSPAMKRTASGR